MRLEDTPEEAQFRKEARQWIAENGPGEEMLDRLQGLAHSGLPVDKDQVWQMAKDWTAAKYDAGYGVLTWPEAYGGRDAPELAAIFAQEEGPLARFQDYLVITQYMCAASLMACASEAQKARFLPRMARGDDIWCQMFSEPGAGSDLAGIRTRAQKVDGGWRINGQKVWTSGAQKASWGTILTRTDPTVRKHKGLSMFFLEMNSPGIEVRPIKLMSGNAKFNEVFFDNVFVPEDQILGAENEGWKATVMTLNSERMAIGAMLDLGADAAFDLANKTGALADHGVRRKVADWMITERGLRACSTRQLTAISEGREAGPESAIVKLAGGVLIEEMASQMLDLLGPSALTIEQGGQPAESLHNMFYFGPAQRAAGGSDEVLKNVIAERVLGLPSPDRPDNRLPFNEIPTA